MKKVITALAFIAALVCTVPASAAIKDDVYVISPRDNIKITVMDHGDLSGTYVMIKVLDSYNQKEEPIAYTVPGADETISITFTVSGW